MIFALLQRLPSELLQEMNRHFLTNQISATLLYNNQNNPSSTITSERVQKFVHPEDRFPSYLQSSFFFLRFKVVSSLSTVTNTLKCISIFISQQDA